MTAECAVKTVFDNFAALFSGMDSEVMRQRVSDMEDVRDRLLDILAGRKSVDLSSLPENTVIVADELRPSITASMDTAHVVGIVAQKGGETSHAAILARALEIPAVLSVSNICGIVADGDEIIVDGEYGEVFVKPLARTVAIYGKKKAKYDERVQELKQYIGKDTRTKDGESFCLAANIGNDRDCAKAMNLGAEGVGLFRTEFFFIEGSSMPTEDAQFEAYKRAAVLAKGKFVTIRTLDIGGDKDIPYMGLVKESNPFLGYRAIRYCLGRVDVFVTQLRAIIRASAFGNIRIMLPLVTNVEEITSTKKIISDIYKDFDKKGIAYSKNIQIGVMIETPAAALIADILATKADFFSIGTNDLTQYTMAVDRGNENVAYLYSVYNPAVLRSIRHIISCGKQAGIEVGMCGEAAANAGMIPLLISFGLDEFSVSPSRILETRKNIAGWTKAEADSVADNVMKLETAKEVANYLNDYISARGEPRK
jgi:phosphotransferase system enzyme I (PtsI)